MRKAILASVVTALAFAAGAATAPVLAQTSTNACFMVTQWDGNWRAPNDRTIYIRAPGRRIFRLDLVSACPTLSDPSAKLITRHDTNSICRAIDWDLKVAPGGPGPAVPCLVQSMTLLTPAEAAALPKNAQP